MPQSLSFTEVVRCKISLPLGDFILWRLSSTFLQSLKARAFQLLSVFTCSDLKTEGSAHFINAAVFSSYLLLRGKGAKVSFLLQIRTESLPQALFHVKIVNA